MIKKSPYTDKRMLEALDHLDPRFVAEVTDKYRFDNIPGEYKPNKRRIYKAYAVALMRAACVLFLIGVAVAVPMLLRGISAGGPGQSVGSDNTESQSNLLEEIETDKPEDIKEPVFSEFEFPEVIEGPLSETWTLPAELAASISKDMIPTDVTLEGMAAGSHLFVNIGEEKYRYKSIASASSYNDVSIADLAFANITLGDALVMIYQDTGLVQYRGQKNKYVIYKIEECSDMSRICLIAELPDGNTRGVIYEYAPALAMAENELEKARNSGCVIMSIGDDIAYNQDIWDAFYKDTTAGKSATVKIARYHNMDPDRTGAELYEATKCDYPRLSYMTVTYDGDTFISSYEGETSKTYKYLMRYEVTYPAQKTVKYYLTHDDSVTYEDIQERMQIYLSSTGFFSGEYVDVYWVYSEDLPE